MRRDYRVIDDEIADNLRRIGGRLLAQAPPSNLKFEFYIVDYPDVNAFYVPGGHVYITRKLIAASKSEDELAGVMAHEIGHAITRQKSSELTRAFKVVLGIDSVGDRKDIYEKYNQFLDNMARNPRLAKDIGKYNEEEEIAADRLSVYLSGRAGYSPDACAQFWNRTFEVGGKTGSVLSDFFGLTKPAQKRLREMQRIAEQLPAACDGPRPESTPQQFEEWKSAVVAYSGLGRRESLPSPEWKRALYPHLRGNIAHMRFSRDGKYLLAQDASSVFVLSREPFEVLFRIDAQDAYPAQFTPESRSVVFYTEQLRVETWSVAEGRRTGLQEMAILNNCLYSKLSPDAKHLACMDSNFMLTLFNVSDGSHVYQTKFLEFGRSNLFSVILLVASKLEFSADGRYFVGSNQFGLPYCVYDFVAGQTLKMPASIKNLLGRSFSFMSEDRFVGAAGPKGEKSAVVKFPSGEVQYAFQAGSAGITPATHGDYLILRPIEKFPAGVLDLTKNKVFMASKQDALDLYDGYFVSERIDGVVFLFEVGKEAALAQAALPKSPLPRTRAVAISADMHWLAVSENSRGAIWDLRKGERVFLSQNFQGAHFTDNNMLLVDFPKVGEDERMIARIDPSEPNVHPVNKPKAGSEIRQAGLFLVESRAGSGSGKSKVEPGLVVSSAETGREVWTQSYPKGAPLFVNFNSQDDRAVLLWGAMSDFVKEESKKDAELKRKTESKREMRGDYYIHILRASNGQLLGKVYVETGMGSFHLRWAEAAGDYLTLYDTQNRLLVYSISTGKRLGQVFGVNGSVSPEAQMLAAENEVGVISVYSLPSMEKRAQLTFSDPLSYVQFSKDGKNLFVLTAGQSTYLFNTANLSSGQ